MKRLAFLVFQSHRKGSYLHDVEVSALSGLLRDADVGNDVIESILDASDPAATGRVLDDLVEHLASGDYGVLVFARIWTSDVVRSIRERLDARGQRPAFVLLPFQKGGQEPGAYDFLVDGDPVAPLTALSEAGGDPDLEDLPHGVRASKDGDTVVLSSAEGDAGRWREIRWTLRPNFRRIRVNPGASPKTTPYVVYGNPGCPYRRPVARVPFWADLDLDPQQVNTRGCSFCNINLAEDFRVIEGLPEKIVAQIRNIREQVPESMDVILMDQDPFPYLERAFERILEAGFAPLHLLIQARADLFLRRREEFERSLALARSGGHRLTPFLVGLENFHQPTLDLFNKGVRAETNVEVVEYLRDVARRFPDVYDQDRVSPGFVLWHPWVTVESLRVNIDAVRRCRLTEFRSELALSKIRLYPDIPFYWKAREDGLLLDSYAEEGLDSSARYGYPEELPYRFAEPDIQIAYTVLAPVIRAHEPIEEIELLALVLDWVEAREDERAALEAEALDAPEALVARFMADHEADVRALQKDRDTHVASRDLEPGEARALQALLQPTWMGAEPAPGGFELARALRKSAGIHMFFAAPGDAGRVHADPRLAAFRLILEGRSDAPAYARSLRYNISYSAGRAHEDRPDVQAAIRALTERIVARDRRRSA